jgi:hypothetical protein
MKGATPMTRLRCFLVLGALLGVLFLPALQKDVQANMIDDYYACDSTYDQTYQTCRTTTTSSISTCRFQAGGSYSSCVSNINDYTEEPDFCFQARQVAAHCQGRYGGNPDNMLALYSCIQESGVDQCQ